jgi:hypothetical protein
MDKSIMADPVCTCGHGMTEHREAILGRAECFEKTCQCKNFKAQRPLVCVCGFLLTRHGNGCLRPIDAMLPISVQEIREVDAEFRMREVEAYINTLVKNGHVVHNGDTLEVYDGPAGDTSNLIFTMPLRKGETLTLDTVKITSDTPVEIPAVSLCTCGHLPSAHTEQVGGDGIYTKCTECTCSNFHAQNMSAESIGERRERLEKRAAELLGELGETHARLVRQAVSAHFGGTTNVTEDDFTGRPLTENAHHFTPQESDIKHIPEVGFEAKEMVEHPQHYGGADDPFEHIKVCEAKGWGYHIGNCTKYLWRVGLKHTDVLEDLKKARWYLDRYITKLEQEQQTKG